MEGWVVSSALLGCIIGAASSGYLSDFFGRKKILLLSAILFLVCAIGSTVSNSVTALVISRIIGGLGVGIASMLSPLYISEFSPAHLRGRMVSLYQFAIVIGVLGAYFSNLAIVYVADNYAGISLGALLNWMIFQDPWRGMFFAGALPSVLFFVLLFCVPESPRWLTKQGKFETGLKYLSRVVGSEQARKELTELSEVLKNEGNSIFDLLKPKMRLAMLIGVLLAFFSQITGINVIAYYGPTIFKNAGLGQSSAFLAQVIVGIVNTLFTIIAIWKVDKFGRKPFLMIGSVGITGILFLLGLLFGKQTPAGNYIVPLLFCMHVAFFAMSFGCMVWVIVSEIFPTMIRGRAMSIGVFVIWISCALVAQTFPWLRDNAGPMITYWIYAALLLPSIFFIWFKVPETKGKTLEEIEKYWHNKAQKN
jgi:SP family arabinose:H+ symporter-like MFS transporter